MRILLTGANGQIGYELHRTLIPLGEVIACDRAAMDLSDPDSIVRKVRDVKPDLIVNAAAYTAVDKAESESELAMAINGTAPGILAEEAKRCGAAIVHYSTDYVFDGEKSGAYVESDPPNPLSVYGRTKLAGEQAVAAAGAPHLVFRTSWVYGNRGRNFMLTMQRLAGEQRELRVVNDQYGSPTWSRLIAEGTALVLARSRGCLDVATGLYHLTCSGRTNWHEFACAVVRQLATGQPVRIHAIPTSGYPTPARRPPNSLLACDRAKEVLGIELPSWDTALTLCTARS